MTQTRKLLHVSWLQAASLSVLCAATTSHPAWAQDGPGAAPRASAVQRQIAEAQAALEEMAALEETWPVAWKRWRLSRRG